MRIGYGYDVHRIVENDCQNLILGGVTIPWKRGLIGHSDADVLTHAVIDSILGALACGDIGRHFPDSDPQYKGISSMKLLAHTIELMEKEGYAIGNIDTTVIAQQPRVSGYIPAIRQSLADAMGCSLGQVSVKATTEEWLGFTGAGAGIAAHAVCLLKKR